jgi:methylated-DNA-[protein]-cysteine S-methyltransferase
VIDRISRNRPAARRTTMSNDDLPKDLARLAAALGDHTTEDDTSWQRLRERVAVEALAAGVADVAVERHASPLGTLVLGATEAGLVRVGLPSEDEDAVLDELAARISPRILRAPRTILGDARRQLDEYFAGRRRAFELLLDWRLTAGFRRAVLRSTAAIPFGRTATYREVAAQAGSPAAFRATGSALATNPLPIVVPCHRVLPTGGGVGQYRGGAAAKAQLLALEGAL